MDCRLAARMLKEQSRVAIYLTRLEQIMNPLSRILAVVDPTAADQPALRRAAWLAKNNAAELELLVCYYNEYLSGDRLFDSPSLEKARQEVIEGHEKKLEVLAEPLR
ncbi:MAG: universal stress protein, partial [Woeseiaceae bacterium]